MFRFGAMAVAMVVGLAAGAAQAVTINYDSHVSGEDLGSTTIASLELTQNGANVDFVLTNVLSAYSSSFVKDLGLNFIGADVMALRFGNYAGVDPASFSLDATPPNGNPYNLVVNFNTSNRQNGALRLNPGESSSFTILGASVGDFGFDPGATQLHMNATRNGQSTKYTGTGPADDTPLPAVPLPAAGLLLLGGLAGMAALRRRA